jgi:hypothetical protein
MMTTKRPEILWLSSDHWVPTPAVMPSPVDALLENAVTGSAFEGDINRGTFGRKAS